MSKYSERVQEILKYATSKKIMDKRKCVVELLELYENQEAIDEICKNMEENVQGVANWSYIMHTVHKLLLNETDRLACKDMKNKATIIERQKMCTLVRKTIQCANCYKMPLLKCKDIMPLILQILGTRVYEYYHETYVGILVSYILPFRVYQVKMLPEHWAELLKICINLYKNVSSFINKRTILEALQMICYYGCLHSDLLPQVKETLLFLENVFIDVKVNEEILAESAYKLANAICREIATECRTKLCRFSETVLPNIISLKSSMEKYKLFLLFIKIHHPKGLCNVCDGAYADDWEKWYTILTSIYLMILKDLKAEVLSNIFLQLASEVFKQMLQNSNIIVSKRSLDDCDYIQPAKRRKFAMKIDRLVDMIVDNNAVEAWPIIQILTVLLKQYPECLKSEDLTAFLKTFVDLLTLSCKDEVIMDNLYELTAILLVNEKMFSTADVESCNIYWDKIWDILLRSLNVNQNEKSTHKLTQLFIINSKITNPNLLLKLYLTNVIKWSVMSIRTLVILCEYLPLPTNITMVNINSCSPSINSNSVRLCLLKWALDVPWQKVATKIPIEEFSLLLISISSKSRSRNHIKFNMEDFNNSCNCLKNLQMEFYKEIENCYLLLSYNTNLSMEEDSKEENKNGNESILYMQDIINYLTSSLCDIMNQSNTNDLHIMIVKITIVAKVVSTMKKLNIIPKNMELLLLETLQNYLKIVYSLLASINSSRINYIYLQSVIKVLTVLYESSYSENVTEIIVSSTTLEMLKTIFGFMNIEDDISARGSVIDHGSSQSRRKYSDREFEECNFCHNGAIKILAAKALAFFCCMKIGKLEIQTKLTENLLKIEMYDLSKTVDFKMAVVVLESLNKYGEELWKNHGKTLLKNFLTLCDECYLDETKVIYLFNILPYFVKYSIDHNYDPDQTMAVISKLNLGLKKKFCFKIHVEFTKCLSKIIRLNSLLLNNPSPVIDAILSSLANPLVIVRLETLKCVQEFFFSSRIPIILKETLFLEIEKLINKSIIVDERESAIASSLLVLSAILSATGTFQSRALLSMLRFTIDQNVEIELIPKSLNTIVDKISYEILIEENLSFLITYWFDSSYSSRPFPWKITPCNSEIEFYKIHARKFAFIKFQKFEISSISSFCNYVSLPLEQMIENIFPEILIWLLHNIQENGAQKKLANKMFRKLISNEDEFLRMKKFSNLFNEKFEDILMYLVHRLHDEDNFEAIFNLKTSFVMSDPPHLKKSEVHDCLEYMKRNFFEQETSVQFVLAKSCPNIFQNILINLIRDVHKKKFAEHRMKSFYQYVFFCDLMMEDLKEEYFNDLSTFLIKEIGYSLLHIIKLQDCLLEMACGYFYKFTEQVSRFRSEDMKRIVSFAVVTLIPIVNGGKVPITLEILGLLSIHCGETKICNLKDKVQGFLNSSKNENIIHKAEELRTLYEKLETPQEPKIRSLEVEVHRFLDFSENENINCSAEDISNLRLQLSRRKEELRILYKKLESIRGFSEDCVSSALHCLICKLIKLTASSDPNISMEASKCLGELGPNNLSSMILYLEKSYAKETSDLLGILSYKVVTKLVQFLHQSDVDLKKVSVDAFHVILTTFWGHRLSDTKYTNCLKSDLGEPKVTLPSYYIKPFTIAKNLKPKKININVKVNDILNPCNSVWTILSDGLYSDWIIKISCKILECFVGFYSESLISVCKLSTDICEIILPRIIFLLINIDSKYTSEVCLCVNRFFDYHFNFTMEPTMRKIKNCDHQIVRTMLNVVNYVRIQVPDNVNLKFNYMYIAKAAQYCSAFFTAILYAEMACENILSDSNEFSNVSKVDCVYEFEPERGRVIQNILRDAYTKIGDFDAIHGTGTSHLQDHATRIQHYVQSHEWNRVILAQDVELSFGNMSVIKEMANGLYKSGLQYLLGNFVSFLSKETEEMDENIQYECAWRLSNWNLCETNQSLYLENESKSTITEFDYHFYHYQALKYFHEGNEIGIKIALENARISVIKALKNISLESSKTIYEKLMQLQLIREIEELSFCKPEDYENLLKKWREQDLTNLKEFQYLEPILTQRIIMYRITNNEKLKNAMFDAYLEISKMAVDKENLDIATRSLAVLAKQKDLPSEIEDQLLYQESLLARLREDLEIGRFLLKNLMNKENLNKNLRAQVLRVYGDWMAEMKSENPEAVIKKYYLKSIDTSTSIEEETSDSVKNLRDTQVALARFADAQFEQICSYMKSPQFETLKECILYSSEGISVDSVSRDKDVRKALILNQRQNINDVAELERIEKEKDNYLILALKYYLIVLQQSENYNLLIFRIVTLWLDNVNKKEVNNLLQLNLNKISSFKFIPLAPQLAAHMNDIFDDFSEKIYEIMKRCALEHPHHTLPVLLALKNLYGDYEYNVAKKNKTLEPRVLGAKKLLQELMKSDINSIVCKMDKLSHSLVMLANLTTSSSKPGSIVKIPKNQEILNVKNFENILVPTLTIDLKPSGDYSDIISIFKYKETYETVGGMNSPKKLVCIGMDGIERYQLIKGKDDLRQDAVMQQVFNVMNILLKTCKETKRRKLMIRTYKVVPLTQRSGILEWCDNTIPIMTILTGSNSVCGLQKKYYPKDYTASYCKEKLAAVEKSSTEVKLKVFTNCCTHLHPVMHHFFTEKYPSPETWFERRLAYTRSIATTSMAGYILGLGDRHLNNILIDQSTAEVIHIDFGIAFEQGKVLPIPETIPFRLTQNIEAAMGVSGIEGTMRHCSEKTLNVLRDQKQVIITLLQVLLYDPLFTWTVTPARAHNIQCGNSVRSLEINQCSTVTNKTAEKALLRIEQKLQGTEEGLASSVSGQVERLIQQARDPLNLCRLYCGWQPYL
ncbi:serine/threonine-protein kinase tefu isoform X1 [Colletes latitarsis]|uniref:serine/threonine-protein kinase tefu isoform X1 n=1 Tax=Colletes latitarsis TaxID=2605962 RepID=UPI0040370CEC